MRFDLVEMDHSFCICREGEPDKLVQTETGSDFCLPTFALAKAIRQEMNGAHGEPDLQQELAKESEKKRSKNAPWLYSRYVGGALTGLALRAIELTEHQRQALCDELAGYALTDQARFRADRADGRLADLWQRQEDAWKPIVDYASEQLGVSFTPLEGVMPPPDGGHIDAAAQRLGAWDVFCLMGSEVIARISGSFALTLAYVEGRIDSEIATRLSFLEEEWQREAWAASSKGSGESGDFGDFGAEANFKARQAAFQSACDFMEALYPVRPQSSVRFVLCPGPG